MPNPDDEFLQQLLATFRVEADEHLQAISAGLLELEKNPAAADDVTLVETIFREAHSLKGAARAVSLSQVEAICQAIENIFSAWKRKELRPIPEQFDTLHHALDVIDQLLASDPGGAPVLDRRQLSALLDRISQMKTAAAPAAEPSMPPPPATTPTPSEPREEVVASVVPAPPPPEGIANPVPEPQPYATQEKAPLAETVRIATAKLDALLLQAEETVAMKLNATQRATDLHEIKALLEQWHKQWARISPGISPIRQGLEKSGSPSAGNAAADFFDWSHAHFKMMQDKLNGLTRAVEHDRRSLGTMVDNLLEETKKLLMLPFSVLLSILPRLVRDLAREQGKEVQLLVRGGDVEIDKRILEELKDPLVHLLRNCVDHGIEKPGERQGKPRLATVSVTISQVSGSEVEVVVADDGKGIDLAAVKAGAVKHGLLDADAARRLDDFEALSLIFQSGVSTSPIVTAISGRGLGLAIVWEKVDKLNGHIFVDTQRNRGTTFRILLPLTLATFKGVLVKIADQCFVLPTSNLERVKRILPEEVKTVENRETIVLDQRAVSLVRLADVLEMRQPPAASMEGKPFPALVLSSGEKRIAFRVDEVLNEQEVLVKPLGKPLLRVRNVAGATVLGSGQAVPILNAADLIKSAMKGTGAPTPALPVASKTTRKSLLLVEDSITARMLLKNILESAGYRVKTAVDGLDAWTTLKNETFDAVVTDVDMPRMDGFDLTAKIRAEKRLLSLPVVLVTGRESREDRERGIDAGANAYIIKSSFDQSNLLEVMESLL